MDSMTFVLFGSTGDLAKRKIYPALFNLFLGGKLPDSFSIIGVGRRKLSQEEYRTSVTDSLYTFSRHLIQDTAKKEQFVRSFTYCQMDISNLEEYKRLQGLLEENEKERQISQNRMFYLSVAPEFFDIIAGNIKKSGLGDGKGWKRLIIEKPFGRDLQSAQVLNETLNRTFEEDEIYRIDHYLGKPMVQTLEALTFANPILQSLWNNRSIANVQITASEIVGVEERASYYDKSGAIRDMLQNHLLQLVMMTAMHFPQGMNKSTIRQGKSKVMETLRPLQAETVGVHVVRGQYGPGVIGGKPVPGYRAEPGVDDSSQNDTFVAARLWIDNALWDGVPFFIRTGKRMAEKSTKIVLEFKNPSKGMYSEDMKKAEPNLLTLFINPNEGVELQLNMKNPVSGEMEPVKVDFSVSKQAVPEAYELLLLDALNGDPTFFAHWREVELSWKWVEPILKAFRENRVELQSYPAGSMGPEAAHALLNENGFRWW